MQVHEGSDRPGGGGLISDVSQGPGWWQAPDGKWFPPGPPAASPSPSPSPSPAPAPAWLPASSSPADDTVAPPVVVRPSSDGAGLPPFRPVVDSVVPTPLRHEVDDEPLTAPSTDAGVGAWSQFDAYRSPEQLSVAQVHSAEHGPRLAPRDPRGAAAALASLVLFGLTFLDWYAITLTFAAGRALQGRATVYQVGYRGWYLVIPGVAVLGVVVGVLNFLLRVTDDWAVTVFVALRLLAVAAVVLMALALVFVHPYDLTSVAGDASTATAVPLTVHVSRLWPAWAALGAAVVMLLSTLTSPSANKE